MPYFIILPAFAVLFAGLVAVALLSLAFKPFRHLCGYIFCGAFGTIPGFLFGNAVFWIAIFSVGRLLPGGVESLNFGNWSEVVAIGFGLLFAAGLAAANVIGCAIGFLGGIWVFARLRRTTPANKPMQTDEP